MHYPVPRRIGKGCQQAVLPRQFLGETTGCQRVYLPPTIHRIGAGRAQVQRGRAQSLQHLVRLPVGMDLQQQGANPAHQGCRKGSAAFAHIAAAPQIRYYHAAAGRDHIRFDAAVGCRPPRAKGGNLRHALAAAGHIYRPPLQSRRLHPPAPLCSANPRWPHCPQPLPPRCRAAPPVPPPRSSARFPRLDRLASTQCRRPNRL